MKTNTKKFYSRLLSLSITIFLILFSINTSCQDPDAWEARQNDRQPPDKVMDAIGVKPGMVIAEVGAGRGRYVVHMAARTGSKGKVYANDIDKEALEYLDHRCERDDIDNVETILGTETDPKLPASKMDLVYIVNTYHHIEQVVPLMQNIVPALKSGGVLVIIENEPTKSGWDGHSTPKDQLIEEVESAGFKLDRMIDILEMDMIYLFKAGE